MDKRIGGQTVRKNAQHRGMWDIIGEGGRHQGKPTFTGTMAEVRAAIKIGNDMARRVGR